MRIFETIGLLKLILQTQCKMFKNVRENFNIHSYKKSLHFEYIPQHVKLLRLVALYAHILFLNV